MVRTVVTPQLPPGHNRLALIRWSNERQVRFKSVVILVTACEFSSRIVRNHRGRDAGFEESKDASESNINGRGGPVI
jgi:hypothetical protein